MLNICMKFQEDNLEWFSNYSADAIFSQKLLSYKVQRAITKTYKQDLLFFCVLRRLMMLNICMKFRQDIWNSFQVIKRTLFRMIHILLFTKFKVNISVMFHEAILNDFNVIEWTRFCDRTASCKVQMDIIFYIPQYAILT